jgi:hypothetical protein
MHPLGTAIAVPGCASVVDAASPPRAGWGGGHAAGTPHLRASPLLRRGGLSGAPATGSSGSSGRIGSSGTRGRGRKSPPSYPVAFDKVWRQCVSAKHPLKPTLNPTLNRHAYSTRLILPSFAPSCGLSPLLSTKSTKLPTKLATKWGHHSKPSLKLTLNRHASSTRLILPGLAASRGLSLPLSTKAAKLLTKLATKWMKALKGRDIPAQGNALGNGAKNDEP